MFRAAGVPPGPAGAGLPARGCLLTRQRNVPRIRSRQETGQVNQAMIGRGEKAEAGKQLSGLSRALKGTALEERALALLEQTKAA